MILDDYIEYGIVMKRVRMLAEFTQVTFDKGFIHCDGVTYGDGYQFSPEYLDSMLDIIVAKLMGDR